MKSWFLVQCKPRQEQVAQQNLKRQGYTTYLPLTTVRRRKAGKSVTQVGPMFPRYLFIQLSEETDDWRPIRSTIGVANLVRFGQIPAKVPEQLISGLKLREDNTGVYILPEPEFKKGDKVLIAEGIFEGYEAVFQSRSARDRVSLLITMLQKTVNIELDQRVIDKPS